MKVVVIVVSALHDLIAFRHGRVKCGPNFRDYVTLFLRFPSVGFRKECTVRLPSLRTLFCDRQSGIVSFTQCSGHSIASI